MKTSLVIILSIISLFSLQGQDGLVMKYQYAFEHERHFRSDIIPLHKYAQVFSIKKGLEEKEAITATSLLQLHKTWRAKKNEDLNYKDFIFVEGSSSDEEVDLIFYEAKQRLIRATKRDIKWILLHESSLGIGGSIATEYWENPRKIPNRYPDCIDEDAFWYTIPLLHEIDWLSTSSNKDKKDRDTLVQKRLFFTDSTLITIENKQWELLDVNYCIGYNLPDTLNNTNFKWKVSSVELPPAIRSSKVKYKLLNVASKKKKIKIGQLCYTFFAPQKLFGEEEYLIKCLVQKKKKTYVKNIFLAKGSQFILNAVKINVLAVNDQRLLVKYQLIKTSN
jgi:hypothetical protein